MIEIERVTLNVTEIQTLIEDGHRVRDTPHLGGPHYGKYALTLGGLASDIVIVDTTKAARDKFGRTQDFAGTRFVSNKNGEQKPAAALIEIALSAEQIDSFEDIANDLGVDSGTWLSGGALNLSGLHAECVKRVVAEDITVKTFADFWRSSGDAGAAMMEYLAKRRLLDRWYDSESGKIVSCDTEDQSRLLEREGRYFDSKANVHGVLPCVEAMFAIEAVQAAVEGREVIYDHLYIMSTEYTKQDDIVKRIRDITEGTLALLGITGASVSQRFIIADNAALDIVGGSKDHFAMLRDKETFNAAALIKNSQTGLYVGQ